ncbi:hypothetical protein E2C01_033747 [Portunus trituberculatus]|uniref:Reverse transcriptase domain-containing protein n=1 Tax=Portunus trituberculatus TaxID=210409 RepID=A0A5B7EZM9_PORTR|nr:hypothetical protein [Portunus trituberculatus]
MAYANDLTLTQSHDPGQTSAVPVQLNRNLRRIIAWGNIWQVRFVPHKTQLLHVTRSSVPLSLDFNGRTMALQDEVEVLGGHL